MGYFAILDSSFVAFTLFFKTRSFFILRMCKAVVMYRFFYDTG